MNADRTWVWCTVLACLFGAAGTVRAAGSSSVYSFLHSDVGARAAALAGGAYTLTEDPNGIFYNVATLGTLGSPRGSAGFFKHLMDINAGHLSYGQAIEGIGYVGAGLQYFNYGVFDEKDALGNTLGTFGANDLALSLGYALEAEENLVFGGAVKFIYSSIAGYTSTGIALDAGVLYHVPNSTVALAASVRNLGTQLSAYSSTREELPLDVSVAASVIPQGLPLLLNVGFHRLTDEVPEFTDRFRAFMIGGEFTLSKAVQLRIGYDNARRQDLKLGSSSSLAGFSGGLGILIADRYNVDYALSSLGKIGSLHQFSLRAAF